MNRNTVSGNNLSPKYSLQSLLLLFKKKSHEAAWGREPRKHILYAIKVRKGTEMLCRASFRKRQSSKFYGKKATCKATGLQQESQRTINCFKLRSGQVLQSPAQISCFIVQELPGLLNTVRIAKARV